MASIVCFTSAVNSITSPSKASSSTSGLSPKSNLPFPNPTHHGAVSRFQPLRVKATESSTNSGTKRNSIVCAECDGNGTGVNSVDHFNGRFKAGASCWLCRGKKEILCGNCNGAGFLGGFMSTFDETSG
uniref:BSD2 cysteine rich domain-containing protein n=1 Tax=Musa acuminata subsp. malaccensis TaxID=214687 RepID=A0A804I5F4_MUSAM|nr:PREDICTED: uncharacterized protein LOC103976483 isoform X4 [Musa acuminata subsp. malaccensis]